MGAFLSWRRLWLIEAVRLKESQWGPIEDTVELRRAVAGGGRLDERVSLRAQLLAERAGWLDIQQRIFRILQLSLCVLAVLFVLVGIGAAVSALRTTDGSVNVFVALLTLLAVPTLSLLAWCVVFFVGGGKTSHQGLGLSRFWLWLSQRWIKGPDTGLLMTAFLGLSSRQKLSRWGLSAVNHALWLVAFLAALCSLFVLLSAKRYRFNWETTLLSAENFVSVVQGLGVIPGWFGFSTPAKDLILQSDGLQWVTASAQVQWSSWLVGCVVVYGMLPRILALAVCLFCFVKQYGQRHIEHHLQGLAELSQRLMPQKEYVGIDAEAGLDQVPQTAEKPLRPALNVSTLCVGVELPADQIWPPVAWPSSWQDAGLVDSREQRAQLLTLLASQSFEHVVLCVDAEQTPDRGVIAWLAELAAYSTYCSVYLVNTQAIKPERPSSADRLEAWQARLSAAGFIAVYTDFDQLIMDLL